MTRIGLDVGPLSQWLHVGGGWGRKVAEEKVQGLYRVHTLMRQGVLSNSRSAGGADTSMGDDGQSQVRRHWGRTILRVWARTSISMMVVERSPLAT